ncbi:wax ester/triacylglycerol synthase family O-acyltransferase [Pendulispora rubella]|uniref:diacylglycerol O-acyltransferase n=1 Tax=Pendulispora rubella TaxID=2741070 RepID=A0ABZ2KQ87_9BACT
MDSSTREMSSWHEPLSGLDASFLYLEDRTAHMHVGSVALFEGPAPSYEELVTHIGSRIHRVPRYRQRLAFVPLQIGRPAWVDDARFDVRYHVRRAALPAPGGEKELKELASRLFAQQLDRERPLWEMYLVEGLEGGRFAIVAKTHHCMVDGISSLDLAAVLLDGAPSADAAHAPAWNPRPAPSRRALVKAALRDQVRRPLELVRGAVKAEGEARSKLSVMAGGIVPLLLSGTQLLRTPESSLNQPIGPHRRYEMVSLDLPAVKAVGAALGGKVNDVVLAVVAGALRRVLSARGESLTEDLQVMVPVNVRRPGAAETTGNHVAMVFCPLPVRCADPVERLHAVGRTMAGLKKSKLLVGSMALTSLSDFSPPPLAAPAARLSMRETWFNLVVTNVPGPQMQLFLLGRRMLRCHPLVPLAPKQTLGIALLSYNGSLDVGLLADADHARDLPDLAEAMKLELAELLKLAMPAPKSEPARARTTTSVRESAAVA